MTTIVFCNSIPKLVSGVGLVEEKTSGDTTVSNPYPVVLEFTTVMEALIQLTTTPTSVTGTTPIIKKLFVLCGEAIVTFSMAQTSAVSLSRILPPALIIPLV